MDGPGMKGNGPGKASRLPAGPCRGSRSRGFTLPELAMVLVLVAILGTVAMSRRSTINYDAYSDAEILKGALRSTRTRAMADIVPWSLQVAGKTGTVKRNGVTQNPLTITFATAGVAAGTTTFDNRGAPTGTTSFAVAGFSGSPVTVTAQTGFVP